MITSQVLVCFIFLIPYSQLLVYFLLYLHCNLVAVIYNFDTIIMITNVAYHYLLTLLIASRYVLRGYSDRRVWVQGPGWLDYLCQVMVAYALRLNSQAGTEGYKHVFTVETNTCCLVTKPRHRDVTMAKTHHLLLQAVYVTG